MEAMRALRRRLSDAVYRQLVTAATTRQAAQQANPTELSAVAPPPSPTGAEELSSSPDTGASSHQHRVSRLVTVYLHQPSPGVITSGRGTRINHEPGRLVKEPA